MSRVAVASGGTSVEREVSRRGARRVSQALRQGGHAVVEMEIDDTVVEQARALRPDYVFIVAHGRSGEDGSLQALLELLGIAYTGSDALASALCLDKVLAKRTLLRAGLPTPPFASFSRRTFEELGAAAAFDAVLGRLGASVVVKPARLGSSFGVKYVEQPDGLRAAVLGAVAYDDEILVERHVPGRELAVTVLGGGPEVPHEALPIVEILSTSELYDYEDHYDFDLGRLEAPARLSAEERAAVEAAALGACRALGTRDVARVDIILATAADPPDGPGGQPPRPSPQILEVNTIPGLTETGPTPVAAEAAGLDFATFVDRIAARAGTPTPGDRPDSPLRSRDRG